MTVMTIRQAFEDFIKSEGYKEKAKIDSKYRNWLYRFNNGQLKDGGIVEILLANGYEVTANKAGNPVAKKK